MVIITFLTLIMELQRKLFGKLKKWKDSKNRKPLLLQGARQVGKTWLLKEFGKDEFHDLAYFNFEEQEDLKQFFEHTKDIDRIIQNLSMVHQRNIKPQETLIVFDEIQECSSALNSLKYFCEEGSEYFVAGAGSLLGVATAKGNGFPVGKVQFLSVYPLDFDEFLLAAAPQLATYLDNLVDFSPIPDIFFDELVEKLKMYFVSGGMPEAVVSLLEDGIETTQNVLNDILKAYSLDFSKYAKVTDIPKLNHIWKSIPSQLAKANKKFIYKKVRSGARSREYEDALLWLEHAGLIYRIYRINKPGLPLSAYDDLTAFKVYLLDVGLLRRLARLNPIAIKEGNRLFTEFKGALTENFILQHLAMSDENIPRYWASSKKAEIDFIIQYHNDIIPIEVKSDKNIKSRSLTLFHKKYQPPVRLRYSLRNLKYQDGLLNIPLFMVSHTERLINIAAKSR